MAYQTKKGQKKVKVRAAKVIAFIEQLTVPSGVGQGKPFKLRPWQQRFIRDVYEPHVLRDGAWRRRVRRAVLSIGRKNGKTALIAALALVHLVGPEEIPNGEIYSAANDREQAAQVYKVVAQMVRAEPELEAQIRLVDSTKTAVCYANGSFYRAISSEVSTKHGLNPSVVIFDELAQARNRDLYDVLDTAMGAREEPLFATISTQSNDPRHILSQLIDDGLRADDPTTVTHLYAVADEVADQLWCPVCSRQFKAEGKKTRACPVCGGPVASAIYDEREWIKANPALGDFRSLEDMRAMASRAQRMPSFEAAFRNLYLNQRIDSKAPLIAKAEWMACQDEDCRLIPGEKIFIGLDLSSTTDLTAMVAVSAEDGDRCQAWFWKPGDLLKQHETRDRVPYVLWEQEGHIEAPPGRAVDYGFVAQRIAEVSAEFQVVGLAYDRWRIEGLFKELITIGCEAYVDGKEDPRDGALRLAPWGQGFKDMAPAIDALEISILERRFQHGGHPVLTWCFSNAVAVQDPAGNRKLDKSRTRFRIDGAVATAMAMGLKAKDSSKPQEKSFWEN